MSEKEHGPHRANDGDRGGNKDDGQSSRGEDNITGEDINAKGESPLTNLDWALAYARAGIKVIPCWFRERDRRKPPLGGKGWRKRATTDEATIRNWFTRTWHEKDDATGEPVIVRPEHVLIGIVTGATTAGEDEAGNREAGVESNHLLIHDGDVKPDGRFDETIPHYDKLSRVIARTPSGGVHVYYRHEPKQKLVNSAGKIRFRNRDVILPGWDVRSNGGYVIAPGSMLPDGRRYEWLTPETLVASQGTKAILPEPDLARITAHVLTGNAKNIEDEDKPNFSEACEDPHEQAIKWLEGLAERVGEASSGTRDETLKDKMYQGSAAVIADIVSEKEYSAIFWRGVQACGLDKDLSPGEYDTKVRNALEKGRRRSVKLPWFLKKEGWLEHLNDRHFVVTNLGGRTLVCEWVPDAGRHYLNAQSWKDFEHRYANNRVKVGEGRQNKVKSKSIAELWHNHPKRREFDDLILDPDRPREFQEDDRRKLNMWRGLAVAPHPGSWRQLRRHIFFVLANKDKASFKYIIRWAAWAVQNPGDVAGVAMFFRGDQGSGRGIFARTLKKVFGQHGLHVASADKFTGRFNYHLSDVCFLFADEAVAPKDKAAIGRLKALITEPRFAFEAKGRDIEEKNNHVKIIGASNEDWIAPVEKKDRRYAVFDVCNDWARNEAYFNALYAEVENGGDAALLYALQNVDLSGWHPRNHIPDTQARREQQLLNRSTNPFLILLEERLEGWEGRLPTHEARRLINLPEDRWEPRHHQWFGEAMRQLKWDNKQMRKRDEDEVYWTVGGGANVKVAKPYHYVKGDDTRLLTHALLTSPDARKEAEFYARANRTDDPMSELVDENERLKRELAQLRERLKQGKLDL